MVGSWKLEEGVSIQLWGWLGNQNVSFLGMYCKKMYSATTCNPNPLHWIQITYDQLRLHGRFQFFRALKPPFVFSRFQQPLKSLYATFLSSLLSPWKNGVPAEPPLSFPSPISTAREAGRWRHCLGSREVGSDELKFFGDPIWSDHPWGLGFSGGIWKFIFRFAKITSTAWK